MEHPHVEFMRKYSSAWITGDIDTVRASFNEDLEVSLPGRSSFAGVYRGVDALFSNYIEKVYALTGGNIRMTVKDIVANDDRAIVLAKERFERPGRTLDVDRVLVYEFRTERISGIRQFESDQYAVDEFLDYAGK